MRRSSWSSRSLCESAGRQPRVPEQAPSFGGRRCGGRPRPRYDGALAPDVPPRQMQEHQPASAAGCQVGRRRLLRRDPRHHGDRALGPGLVRPPGQARAGRGALGEGSRPLAGGPGEGAAAGRAAAGTGPVAECGCADADKRAT